MPPPLAYFLTWTCYGTWLRGDERGSVDTDHNAPGQPFARPSTERVRVNASRLKSPPLTLTPSQRDIVEKSIQAHCAHRGWKLHAINARTNHVHVVVTCDTESTPERAMNEFKAWATRDLRKAHQSLAERKLWTAHGSTRWLKDRDSLAAAVTYVLECQ